MHYAPTKKQFNLPEQAGNLTMKQFKKLLVISGPTATGKTALAASVAQKFNGELVSADSRQVYIGMDIGTGKDIDQKSKIKNQNNILKFKNIKYSVGYFYLNANSIVGSQGDSLAGPPKAGRNAKGSPLQKSIPLWLLDVVTPDQPFSVSDYQKLAQTAIQDIWKRGKLPILVGGTGFYIKSIIDGIDSIGIPQNQKLREKLYTLSLSKLQNSLKSLNPPKWNSMNSSDQQNPRRLVRAIEIALSKMPPAKDQRPKTNSQFLHLSLTAPNEIIFQRIDDRVEKRVEQGIINEIKSLLEKGYTWDLPSMSACGYRVWKDYFEKKATLEETIQKWKFEEHNYARRQLTWFKKDKRIKWFDITDKNYIEEINKLIADFILFYPSAQ